jgi:hypothetical protein
MRLKGNRVDHRLMRTGSAHFPPVRRETRQDNDLVALRGESVCAGFDAKFDRAWGRGWGALRSDGMVIARSHIASPRT